jgi:hypothetical protein
LRPGVLGLGFGFRDSALFAAAGSAPFIAGWLYDIHPTLPLYAGMAGIAITIAVTFVIATSKRLTGICKILCSMPTAQSRQEKWQLVEHPDHGKPVSKKD